MASASRVMRGAQWVEPLREALAVAPADPAAWVAQHTRVIKSDTYSRVGLFELQQQPCFLKLYLAKSPLQSLGFRLGLGRPFRSFDAARQMRDRGLPVPAPRACLSLPAGVVLLTEAIPASQDLRALWQSSHDATRAAQLLHCAGETLAVMHRAGFAHGDCKWSNLLWDGEQFYLVDLERVRAVGSPQPAAPAVHPRQVRDLARFTVDAEERGASQQQYDVFLDAYCVAGSCIREQLLAALATAAAAIRRRHAKKHGSRYAALV